MTKQGDESAAVVTIRDPGQMTDSGVADICKWLERIAKDLKRHHRDMGKTMRYRYLCRR